MLFNVLLEILSRTKARHQYISGKKKIAYARCPRPLYREGFLSCHTCCDVGIQFYTRHIKDHPVESPLTKSTGTAQDPLKSNHHKGKR